MISKKPTDEDLFLIHNKYFPPMVIGRDIYLKFARELLQQFGEIELPEPVRKPLDLKTTYWVADPTIEWPRQYSWAGEYFEHSYLQCGLIHLTKEAAQTWVDFFLSLTGKTE